jgi:hypothetical protein
VRIPQKLASVSAQAKYEGPIYWGRMVSWGGRNANHYYPPCPLQLPFGYVITRTTFSQYSHSIMTSPMSPPCAKTTHKLLASIWVQTVSEGLPYIGRNAILWGIRKANHGYQGILYLALLKVKVREYSHNNTRIALKIHPSMPSPHVLVGSLRNWPAYENKSNL